MPYKKPAKPCAHPGSWALIHKRLCPDHARQEAPRYERQQRHVKALLLPVTLLFGR